MSHRDAWGPIQPRRMDVELPHPRGHMVRYQSVSSDQWRDLEALGRAIRGTAPQVVGVAAIIAYAHGDRELLEAVVPAQLELIDAYVADETTAGRPLSSWLVNNQINRARIG